MIRRDRGHAVSPFCSKNCVFIHILEHTASDARLIPEQRLGASLASTARTNSSNLLAAENPDITGLKRNFLICLLAGKAVTTVSRTVRRPAPAAVTSPSSFASTRSNFPLVSALSQRREQVASAELGCSQIISAVRGSNSTLAITRLAKAPGRR